VVGQSQHRGAETGAGLAAELPPPAVLLIHTVISIDV
jgi:hypothetical protein